MAEPPQGEQLCRTPLASARGCRRPFSARGSLPFPPPPLPLRARRRGHARFRETSGGNGRREARGPLEAAAAAAGRRAGGTGAALRRRSRRGRRRRRRRRGKGGGRGHPVPGIGEGRQVLSCRERPAQWCGACARPGPEGGPRRGDNGCHSGCLKPEAPSGQRQRGGTSGVPCFPVSTSQVVITHLPPTPGPLETSRVVLALKLGAGKKVHKCKRVQNLSVRHHYWCEINEAWPSTELHLRAGGWVSRSPRALCSGSSRVPVMDVRRRSLAWEIPMAMYITPKPSRSCLSGLNSGAAQHCGA